MKRKILIVVTSFGKYPGVGRPTGLWLGEAVQFLNVVQTAGYDVDFVSPRGGYTPIDPVSLTEADPLEWEYYENKEFMNRLGATLPPGAVDPTQYGCIYFTGGHGVVWDFPDSAGLQSLARQIYEQGGIVSSVCHGAVGLLNLRLGTGALLIDGRRVTGFSNVEERLLKLDQYVPYMTETELRARGAHYQRAAEPWAPWVVEDGRLLTGQNPASSKPLAEMVVGRMNNAV